jgi:hypothetical protein
MLNARRLSANREDAIRNAVVFSTGLAALGAFVFACVVAIRLMIVLCP